MKREISKKDGQRGETPSPSVPAIAYNEKAGGLTPTVASRVRNLRKWIAEHPENQEWKQRAWLEQRRDEFSENLETHRKAARAYCRRFLETMAEEIPFDEQKAGLRALDCVRWMLRDVAAWAFLIEEAEHAKVVRLVPRSDKEHTAEAIALEQELQKLADLPPYERARVLAIAREFARKVKEREATVAANDDEEEEEEGPEKAEEEPEPSKH